MRYEPNIRFKKKNKHLGIKKHIYVHNIKREADK